MNINGSVRIESQVRREPWVQEICQAGNVALFRVRAEQKGFSLCTSITIRQSWPLFPWRRINGYKGQQREGVEQRNMCWFWFPFPVTFRPGSITLVLLWSEPQMYIKNRASWDMVIWTDSPYMEISIRGKLKEQMSQASIVLIKKNTLGCQNRLDNIDFISKAKCLIVWLPSTGLSRQNREMYWPLSLCSHSVSNLFFLPFVSINSHNCLAHITLGVTQKTLVRLSVCWGNYMEIACVIALRLSQFN